VNSKKEIKYCCVARIVRIVCDSHRLSVTRMI
jgi:hypothetical protein